jgi:hypothetical protein
MQALDDDAPPQQGIESRLLFGSWASRLRPYPRQGRSGSSYRLSFFRSVAVFAIAVQSIRDFRLKPEATNTNRMSSARGTGTSHVLSTLHRSTLHRSTLHGAR